MQTEGFARPEIFERQKWLGGQRPFESQLGTQMSGGFPAGGMTFGRHVSPGEHAVSPLMHPSCKQ